jgi:hypothetical protein
MRFKDISLQQFGRLMPSFPVGVRNYKVFWMCLCDCGNTKVVRDYAIWMGVTRSCGCLARETAAAQRFKHGHCYRSGASPTYHSWKAMIERCTNPKSSHWPHYGGANPPVKVCELWLNSFEAFLTDMGERPANTTLGRFGDVGDYCKENCTWQT